MIRISYLYKIIYKTRKSHSLAFLLLALLLTAFQAPLPYLSGHLIDQVLPSSDSNLLLKTVLLLATLYGGYLITSYVNAWFRLKVRREIMIDFNQNVVKSILGLNYNQRLKINNGDLLSRVTRDIEQFEVIMPYGLSSVVHHLILSVALLIIVFFMNWQLSAILLTLLPAAVIVYMRFDSALWSSSKDETDASAKKITVIQETIEADAEIKTYGAETFFLGHSRKAVENLEYKRCTRELYDAKVSMIIMGIPMLAMVIIWYLGGAMVIEEQLTIGLIITYTATLNLMVPSLIRIIEFASSIPNELTALMRVKELCDLAQAQSEQYSAANAFPQTEPSSAFDAMTLDNMSFSYHHDSPLFTHLNLVFDKGRAHLINGGNGAGKSTLLTILSGQLQPQSGQIRLDSVDLNGLSHRSQSISMVPQKIHIISDSIRNNVTFGMDVEQDKIQAALKQVGLGQWIARLEKGIDHVIKDARSELSGGQIQKLGLARALLRDTPVLLMDEPTNNLDSEAVKLLIDIIKTHKQSKIVVIVSHDDRLFDAVDRVVYLEVDSLRNATRVTENSTMKLGRD
ncbi:ABC transporter ATP-binding protein/permease [Enterovibrio sp. ZSDZ35]|uniref:ABC transporter ATP-binding protein/permease n=1 Tax=Enterovibrio qingdaonensis TaxID=2899818 RepID=A0ABT5QJX1_9GAMM|nr:ABC transporter ATP-binding protein [Enterovibrio sp. ZSDZ35]MDD1780586.1 ABC transporter ATP-binding protein/permease [Enterovibrio sp. ZSDZ35]